MFPALRYTDWPWGHPASYAVGTGSSVPQGKAVKVEDSNSPPYSAEVKNEWSCYLYFPICFYDLHMHNFTLLSIWIIMGHALAAHCFKIHFASSTKQLLCFRYPTKPSVRSVLYTCCMPRPSPNLILLTIYAEQCRSVLSALYGLCVVMSGYGCVPEYLGCSHDMCHGGGCCFCFYHHIPTSSVCVTRTVRVLLAICDCCGDALTTSCRVILTASCLQFPLETPTAVFCELSLCCLIPQFELQWWL
jgi:hypothetical protein